MFRPVQEPWFDVELVLEDDPAIELWRDTLHDFCQMLGDTGAFRAIRTWHLRMQEPGVASVDRLPAAYLETPAGARVATRTLAGRGVRRLILFATHGDSPAWLDGRYVQVIAPWLASASVAILHLFDRPRWKGGKLGEPSGLGNAPEPGVATANLRVERFWWSLSEAEDGLLPVPATLLTPEGLGDFALMQMARGRACPVFLLDPKPLLEQGFALDGAAPTFERAVALLRDSSADAFLLAVYLSSGAFTLPVARLVQEAMFGANARQSHLAEVLLSGLVFVRSPQTAASDPNERYFEFHDEARAILLGSLREADAKQMANELEDRVSRHLEQIHRRSITLRALVPDANGHYDLPAWAQPFARFGVSLLDPTGQSQTIRQRVEALRARLSPGMISLLGQLAASTLRGKRLDPRTMTEEFWQLLVDAGLVAQDSTGQWRFLPGVETLLAEFAGEGEDTADDEPPATGPLPPILPGQLDNHHQIMTTRLLSSSGVKPLYEALKNELAQEFLDMPAPQSSTEMVKYFAECPVEQVQQLFYVVRRALQFVPLAGQAPVDRLQAEEAAAAMFCMAACRLVNLAAQEAYLEGYVVRVPSSERVICAIIATALFGGELRLLPAEEESGLPRPEFVFEVKVPSSGDYFMESFERAVYVALFPNDRASTEVALDSDPLDRKLCAKLAACFDDIKYVKKGSLALVIHGLGQTSPCEGFASQYQVPVMIPTKEATTSLMGMDADRLLAEIQIFWEELEVLPRSNPPEFIAGLRDPLEDGTEGPAYSPDPELLEVAHKLIIAILEESTAATELLAHRFGLKTEPIEDCRDQVAQKALETPLAKLFDIALDGQQALLKRKPPDFDGAKVLQEFMQALLPCKQDATQIEQIRRKLRGGSNRPIEVLTSHKTIAEIIMAGADRRPTQFRLDGEELFPAGEGLIAHAEGKLDAGLDPDAVQFERDAMEVLAQKFETRFGKEWVEFIGKRFPNSHSQLTGYQSEPEKIWLAGKISKIVEHHSKQKAREIGQQGSGFTYYFLVNTPPGLGKAEKDKQDAALQRLHSLFPGIAFLRLAPSSEQTENELIPYTGLHFLHNLDDKPR